MLSRNTRNVIFLFVFIFLILRLNETLMDTTHTVQYRKIAFSLDLCVSCDIQPWSAVISRRSGEEMELKSSTSTHVDRHRPTAQAHTHTYTNHSGAHNGLCSESRMPQCDCPGIHLMTHTHSQIVSYMYIRHTTGSSNMICSRTVEFYMLSLLCALVLQN